MSRIIDMSRLFHSTLNDDIDRDSIMELVIKPEAEETIREAGIDPHFFTPDAPSVNEFYRKPLEYQDEDGMFASVYFDCVLPEVIYRCECRVGFVIDKEDKSVEAYSNIYKLPDYSNGNHEWLSFDGKDWSEGPGEDFFSLDDFETESRA